MSPRNTIRRHIGRAWDRSGPRDKTTEWGVGRALDFVDPQPGPDLAARIQDGDLITNSGFFDHPTACVQATCCIAIMIINLDYSKREQNY